MPTIEIASYKSFKAGDQVKVRELRELLGTEAGVPPSELEFRYLGSSDIVTFDYPRDFETGAVEVEYATKDEILDFCNRVREAGGGEVLDALLPSTPSDSKSCLIANALNFSCEVSGIDGYSHANGTPRWAMWIGNKETAHKIGSALNLYVVDHEGEGGLQPFAVLLPERLAYSAIAFDRRVAFTEFILGHIDEPRDPLAY